LEKQNEKLRKLESDVEIAKERLEVEKVKQQSDRQQNIKEN
jgi:hypothetical protein